MTKGWYDGGIALPDMRLYYWASQLIVINQWIHGTASHPSCQLERYQTGREGYLGALYTKARKGRYIGPMAQTVNIWHKATGHLEWAGKLTKATPLWSSQKLGLLCHQAAFDKWDTIGISNVRDLLSKGKLLKFKDLQATFSLAPGEIFRYLQIRHALITNIPDTTSLPDSSL